MPHVVKVLCLVWVLSASAQVNELTVETCIDMALANNPAVHIADIQAWSADESRLQAQSDRLPSLSFSGSYRRQSMIPELDVSRIISFLPIPIPNAPESIQLGSLDVFDFRLNLSQPLFTGFQLSNRLKAVQSAALAKKSDAEKSRDDIVYRVRLAFHQCLKAQRFAEIARTGQEQVNEHLRIVGNLLEQGLATQEDRLKVQVKLSEARVTLLQAENAVRLARSTLERTMGKTVPENTRLLQPAPMGTAAVDVGMSLQQALSSRKELTTVKHSRQAAESAVQMVRGSYLPSMAAFASYGYGKPGLNFMDKEWMDYWTAGVGLEWNLWNWRKTSSMVQQARLNAQAVDEALRELELGIRTDVTTACVQVNEAVERIKLTGELEQQAAESYRIMQKKFEQGVAGNSDVLDSQLDLTRARLQKAQAEADYHMAMANYDRAIGKSTGTGR